MHHRVAVVCSAPLVVAGAFLVAPLLRGVRTTPAVPVERVTPPAIMAVPETSLADCYDEYCEAGARNTRPAFASPKPVPMFTLMPQKIAAKKPALPARVQQMNRGKTFVGTYKVCIGADGAIASAATRHSIPGADESIAAEMVGTWRYRPQPVPLCYVSRLVYSIPPR